MFPTNVPAASGLLALLVLTPALPADTLTGRVVDSAGNGVAGVTLDFSGGANPSNPITGAGGFFTIVVQAGTYDIAFLPPNGSLAPIEMIDVRIFGTVNLGNVVLQPGFALSGTVQTSSGLPVPNSNINVYDQATGRKLFTPGDNTGLTGRFSVVVPAGTYRVRASAPPLAILVAAELRDVTVSAAIDVGIIRLRPGFVVTGRVVDSRNGLGVAGVDLDADDALSGERIVTPGDDTDSFGNYRLILPFGLFHLSFDPPPGSLVAQQIFNLPVLSTTTVNTVSLAAGFPIGTTVTGPGGAPVADADIDVFDTTGHELYLAHDRTDGSGSFQVTVPAGTWRVEVEPPRASGLLGARTAPVAVSAPLTLPAMSLSAGLVLSGTILGPSGPEAGVDLDVVDPLTGETAVTPGDFTAADGSYSAIVPAGTFDVHIRTPRSSRAQSEVVAGLSITGPTTLNRQLSLSPMDVAMTPFGLPVVPPGGLLPLQAVTFQNQTAGPLSTVVEIAVRDADGTEIQVFPPIPLNLPPGFPVRLTGMFLPVPNVPPAWHGVRLRYVTRFRDPATGAVQDSDAVPFVAQ